MIKIKELFKCFENINDLRRKELCAHKLSDILVIALLAVLCGADTWTDIEKFGKTKEEWLKTFLELPNGIPSHDTFGTVFRQINPKEFHNSFMEWVQVLCKVTKGTVIAIDGKTSRRTAEKGVKNSALHIVSAWATEEKLVLGQLSVDEKSNEITAIPKLIKLLDISGCIITIDAMGTQKNIAKEIINNKGDYILALKNNHPDFYEDVELYFKEEILTQEKEKLKEEGKYHITYTKDHGRMETRRYYVETNIEWLENKNEWKNIKSIIMVESKRVERGKESIEKRYYISSLKENAEKIGKYQRAHWGIENSLHWVLDVAFREDDSRIRKDNSGENMSVIRHIALNLLKMDTKTKVGIKCKRKMCGWNTEYLISIVNLLMKTSNDSD